MAESYLLNASNTSAAGDCGCGATGNSFVFAASARIVLLPDFQVGSWLISASCRMPVGWASCHRWQMLIFSRLTTFVLRGSNRCPFLSRIVFVTAGDYRRQRKILVVRHRRRNDAGQIKFFAFGFPFVFEFVPGVPAAPVLLGVKQRNQRDNTRAKGPRQFPEQPAEQSPTSKRQRRLHDALQPVRSKCNSSRVE